MAFCYSSPQTEEISHCWPTNGSSTGFLKILGRYLVLLGFHNNPSISYNELEGRQFSRWQPDQEAGSVGMYCIGS